MDFSQHDSIQRWLTALSKKSGSENTKEVYLHYMERFCGFVGSNPDQLIVERQADLKSDDILVKRRAEDRLDRWYVELGKTVSKDGKRLSRNTCALAFNAVRSFYKSNHMPLEMDVAPSAYPEKNKHGLTRENLRTMLDRAEKPIHRALILCQLQSGLSISDLLNLLYNEDVADQLQAERIHLHLRREKEEAVEFDTFFGAMATEALRKYLEVRKPSIGERLFPITDRAFEYALERISLRAGLSWRVGSHDLRRFFSNSLKTTRPNDPAFNDTLVEYWMGHSIGKVKRAYFIPSVEEQLRLYKLAEERLEP